MTGRPTSLSIALWFTGSIWVVGILAYAFDAPVEIVLAAFYWFARRHSRMAHSRRASALKNLLVLPSITVFFMRREASALLMHLLAVGAILCLPTTPFPAPAKGQAISALDIVRDRITCLAAHGGLVGMPQVSMPGATVGGLPVGLSIVGAHRQDATLVAVAKASEDMA